MRKVILTLAVGLFIAGCSSTTNNVVMLDSLPAKKDDSYKETPKSIYQEELEKKLTSLLKTPVTPLKTPDIIVRVLFLPYVAEDGSLVGSHYSYVKIKEGNWILGDYLIEKPYSGSLEGGIVKPLDRRDVGGVLNQVPSSQPQPQSTNTNLNVPVNLPNININPQEPKEVE
ncbi:MAG: TraV family lipoprotein [Sulfurihydrogenibium azorense]|uniref:TraV family lipoprotein n=1 Tax=Sulfurihydrogenibium azorense TaxID=309806 RepID=UPI00391B5D4A